MFQVLLLLSLKILLQKRHGAMQKLFKREREREREINKEKKYRKNGQVSKRKNR
jgi:hypothetical protein